MKAVATNGPTYIVEHNGKYYTVISDGRVVRASPADSPDQFLRFGYFEEPEGALPHEFEEAFKAGLTAADAKADEFDRLHGR